MTGKCAIDSNYFSDISNGIAARCCLAKPEDFFEYLDDYEEVKATNYFIETKPALLKMSPDFDENRNSPVNNFGEVSSVVSSSRHSCSYAWCEENEVCVDTENGHKCDCKAGFERQKGDCLDIDECKDDHNKCSKFHKQCVNTEGSFDCKECLKGYKKSSIYDYDDDENENEYECVDIDECQDSRLCSSDHQCENLDGSYHCRLRCKIGFQNIGDKCVDINECEMEGFCQWNCQNTHGSYKCICPDGYSLAESGVCVDYDECRSNVCGKEEVCTNVKGGYRCTKIACHAGFSYNKISR